MERVEKSEAAKPKRVQLDRITYEVVGIKHGGMGSVALLRRPDGHPDSSIYGKHRAAKTFYASEDDDEALIESELGNWATLHHRNVTPLIRISRLNFQLAALMEQRLGSLVDVVTVVRDRGFPAIKSVLLDVLNGLNYAHRNAHLAHLDLKPGNILIKSMEPLQAEISDWGLSRIMSASAQHADWLRSPLAWKQRQTRDTTQFCGGTLPYMAPERYSGSWEVGPAADVFSVGVMACELLTGKLPTIGGAGGADECIHIITSGEYLKILDSLLARIPATVAEVVRGMLHPNPNARLHDYPALIQMLTQCDP